MKRYIVVCLIMFGLLVGCSNNKSESKNIEEDSNTVEFKVQP